MIREWSKRNESTLRDAVDAMKEAIEGEEGASFHGALSHYADLFQIDESCLRHEWNLRTGDTR